MKYDLPCALGNHKIFIVNINIIDDGQVITALIVDG